MFITFICATCTAKLEVDAISCGSTIECPRCHTTLSVPVKEPGPGTTIGGFKILSLLGKGGMGEVFLARQLSMDRDVAIKILPKGLTTDKEEVERFLNEVRLGARLEHPNIVTAYEAGEDSGIYYLAMAYVRGETLESRLKKTGAMTEYAALRIIRKVASALAYAWNKHHLIHRDVKPANIILNDDGEPKLMDMGLSKSLHEAGPMTIAGTVMGTPNYMSPEQGDGDDNTDFRTDIYSLGATLYTMVTNQLPFAGKTLMETLRKLAVESLPDPREGNVSLSESCARMMERMLARKPKDRYVTWEALIADMDVILAGGTLAGEVLPAGVSVLELASPVEVEVVDETKDVSPVRRSSVPVALGIMAAVLIAGGGLAVWYAMKGGAPTSPKQIPTLAPAPVPATVVIPVQQPVQPVMTDAWHTVVSDIPPAKAPRPHPQPKMEPSTPLPVHRPVHPPVKHPPPVPSPVAAPAPTVNIGEQLETAVDGVLRGNPDASQAALDKIEGQPLSSEATGICDGLRCIVRMKETVLESLKADTGKETDIAFKSGVEHVQILGVEQETVTARRQFKGGGEVAASVELSFNYGDLAPMERVRRMGSVKEADRNVVRAVFALEARKPEQVGLLLSQAESPLGKLMASRWALVMTNAVPAPAPVPVPMVGDNKMAAAENAFRAILDAAYVPANETDEEKRVLEIRKRKYGEVQAGRIKSDLGSFLARFGSTDCAIQNKRILDTLGFIRVNSPLYVDDTVLADAWQKLQRANPVGNVKPAVAWNDDGLSLDFSGQNNLMVISALAGLPVSRLDLTSTQVRDLGPLRGMPLRVFRGGQGEGMPDPDLVKLAPFPLVEFVYAGTEIKSLKWMFGMPLTNISIRCSLFTHPDLRHLKGMRLCSLRIVAWENALADISALKGMPLRELELCMQTHLPPARFPLSEITPLAGMKLTSLSLSNSKIYDLSPLRGMPLTHLDLSGTAVRDLRPLKGMPLKWLSLARTSVNDLTSLAGIPLEFLDLRETRVTDFSGLKDIPTLKNVVR